MGKPDVRQQPDVSNHNASLNNDGTVTATSDPEPMRGRDVVVGRKEIPGTKGQGFVYHTQFSPTAYVMSDDLAAAFLSYQGDPKTRRKLEEMVAKLRPDYLEAMAGK